MKNIFYFIFLFGATLFSCSDPCEDINCGDFGNCDDGTCICETGAYGTNCDQYYRDDFIGEWRSLTHSCDVGNSNASTYFLTPGENIDELEVKILATPDFLAIAKVDGTAITIEPQVLLFGVPVTYSGSGVLSASNRMDLTIVQESDGQPTRTCTYLFEK